MALSWGTEGCRRCQRHPSPPCFLPPGLGCSTWSPARAESPTRRWTAVNPSDLSSSSVRSLCVRCAQVLVADENWCYTMCRCVVNGLSVAFTPWCWCCKDVSGSDALMASWWGGPGDIVYWWDTIISRWIEEKVYFSSFFFPKSDAYLRSSEVIFASKCEKVPVLPVMRISKTASAFRFTCFVSLKLVSCENIGNNNENKKVASHITS